MAESGTLVEGFLAPETRNWRVLLLLELVWWWTNAEECRALSKIFISRAALARLPSNILSPFHPFLLYFESC